MDGRVVVPRRSVTLAAAGSCNLRDLLNEDDRATGRRVVTLASAMAADSMASLTSSSPTATAARTLLDVIRDDQPPTDGRGDEADIQHLARRAVSLSAPPHASPASTAVETIAALPTREEDQRGERVSLMALLEQTGSTVAATGVIRAPAGCCCCVCMVRAKGAAFIPCGHTFCRACARELLAGRGRCPLCNAAILDVLDIF